MPTGCQVSVSDNDLLEKARVDIWERSNRLNLMVSQRTILKTIFGGFQSSEIAKDFLEGTCQKVNELDKAVLT